MNAPPWVLVLLVIGGGCAANDERSPTWGYLHAAVIQPNCATAGCHSHATATAGIDLSTRERAYRTLRGRNCSVADDDPTGDYVVPFTPEGSALISLLRGSGELRMPKDVPLPDREIELVRAWIEDGATCD